MGTIDRNLGTVTAYAYAVKGGYTGTVQQFESMLANGTNVSVIGTNETGRTTASRAYENGEYFYINGKLGKIIAENGVEMGDAWTLDTNYSETTIAAELKERG